MLKAVIVNNVFKKRQRTTDKAVEELIAPLQKSFQPHYVTFYLHDDMDYDATHYCITQRGLYLFSSLNKAKLFVIKSLIRMLVGHYLFDEQVPNHVKQARDIVKMAHEQQSFHLDMMEECVILVEHFYAKRNGDCGVQWQIDLVPQVDVYNEIDLL